MLKKIGRKGKGPNLQQTELYDKITKIEANILKKIQKLKFIPKTTFCHHLSQDSPTAEPYEASCDYYDKYWKQFLRNELSKVQISKLQQQNMHLSERLQKIYGLFQERKLELQPYEKTRNKYTKNQVSDGAQCLLCRKAFKDQQTVNLHTRIKHSKRDGKMAVGGCSDEIYEQEQNQNNDS